MDNVELVWSDARAEVHRFVVGPIENNVYVVRCKRTGEATLLDAANEHDRLLRVASRLGVTSVLETHGHWDHIGAVEAVREAGIDVWVRTEDAGMLPSYDHLLDDDIVHQVGDLRLRTLHTPGHTPGSICFALEETPMLFTGDTLFPGGPGNTNHDAKDFATIITSIDERIFGVFADDVTIWPGHGVESTVGTERPHLEEWVERGW
ncbi:MAG TPA: MBL fold metallo-hydrolase [Acidimicrobiales bacterium]|jgi:glyoxylase-like metal-dependent hydrolase (beta-lactamase superfamily II)|nr:MBL fold metallo-hydrolase [Acidimicrobiales bacterium]